MQQGKTPFVCDLELPSIIYSRFFAENEIETEISFYM